MDDLIADIQERTGLPADKVLEVVTMVTDYMRNALPDDLVAQVTSYLAAAAETAEAGTGTARRAAASAASAATSVASGTLGAARSALADLTGSKGDA